MGLSDKAKNALEAASGKAEEALGELTDDEQLQADGEARQRKARLRKAAEKAKDAFKG